jgi:hypothetical protein
MFYCNLASLSLAKTFYLNCNRASTQRLRESLVFITAGLIYDVIASLPLTLSIGLSLNKFIGLAVVKKRISSLDR